VFGPDSLQEKVYNQAIVPIVAEVLEGFNCTIFAYGQTGEGRAGGQELSQYAAAAKAQSLPMARQVRGAEHVVDWLDLCKGAKHLYQQHTMEKTHTKSNGKTQASTPAATADAAGCGAAAVASASGGSSGIWAQ
jgi:hypothetical protein